MLKQLGKKNQCIYIFLVLTCINYLLMVMLTSIYLLFLGMLQIGRIQHDVTSMFNDSSSVIYRLCIYIQIPVDPKS